MKLHRSPVIVALGLLLGSVTNASPHRLPTSTEIDHRVEQVMQRTGAQGLALAVIEDGQPIYIRAFGARNATGAPLTADTVMYGASLTKTVVACVALRLVEKGVLDLDRPLASYLSKPLPDYAKDRKYADWSPLRDDERWKAITARHVLTHSTGFANFAFLEPDRRLRIHFAPGSRYAYSGEGFTLLQFALEQGLGVDLGVLTDEWFAELGMTRTSLQWRPEFRNNFADGWNDQGQSEPHDERSRVRAAGSMDTSISDWAKFVAALVSGTLLGERGSAELARPQLPITTAQQFPTLLPELSPEERRADLFAGLGVVVFQGPQGRGYFKGGHNEVTANTLVCLPQRRRAVTLLANDVRAEAGFAELVRFILGETGVPYDWEYGDQPGRS